MPYPIDVEANIPVEVALVRELKVLSACEANSVRTCLRTLQETSASGYYCVMLFLTACGWLRVCSRAYIVPSREDAICVVSFGWLLAVLALLTAAASAASPRQAMVVDRAGGDGRRGKRTFFV